MCPPFVPVAPPQTPLESKTQHVNPSSVHRSAAEHPAIPAPTMTTSHRFGSSAVVRCVSKGSCSLSQRDAGLLSPFPAGFPAIREVAEDIPCASLVQRSESRAAELNQTTLPQGRAPRR